MEESFLNILVNERFIYLLLWHNKEINSNYKWQERNKNRMAMEKIAFCKRKRDY